MTTGYQWAKKNKTRQLEQELSRLAPIVGATVKRRNKFNARKVTVNGQTFDSQREYRVWCDLKLKQRAGGISDLKRQVKYDLVVNGVKIASYTADFTYRAIDGKVWVTDVKSEPTAKKRDFVLIRKLMRACHGIEVEVLL